MSRNEKESTVAAVVVIYNRLELLPGFSTDYSGTECRNGPGSESCSKASGQGSFSTRRWSSFKPGAGYLRKKGVFCYGCL